MLKHFGLIGYPLQHSFSKNFFTQKFLNENISWACYENYSIQKIELFSKVIQEIDQLVGLNVTIPYKKEIIQFLDAVSPAVNEIGACNCIHFKKGKKIGYNTDVTGFDISLSPFLKTRHQKALILGTGGAAVAVAYVLQKKNIHYKFVSRRQAENCLVYHELSEKILDQHLLIINTTPVGQFPHVTEYPQIPYEFITPAHHVFDLIYNPTTSVFLENCKKKGATIQNGYEMLLLQAEESWRIWNL